jgi:hypothetical protein
MKYIHNRKTCRLACQKRREQLSEQMRRPPKKYMKAEKTCAEMEDDADVVPHFHHVPLWT